MGKKATVTVHTLDGGADSWIVDRDGVQGYDVYQDTGYLHVHGGSGNATYAPGQWIIVSMVDNDDVDTNIESYNPPADDKDFVANRRRSRAKARIL